MNVRMKPGTYVLAVSGGVDSMALLDMLAKQAKDSSRLRLIVAHFDHGIRPDSDIDRKLVQKIAGKHNLPFVYHAGKLGAGASEADARKARYEFLNKVLLNSGADSIVTAHHHDDWVETAVLNILRGTKHKGIGSLRSTDVIVRPLLDLTKQELREYADGQKLLWREDITNADPRYRRNHIRHKILPKLGIHYASLVRLLKDHAETSREVDREVKQLLEQISSTNGLNRRLFTTLPHPVALEAMAVWLRSSGIRTFDRKLLERLVVAGKTLAHNKSVDINADTQMVVSKQELALRSVSPSIAVVSSV